MIVRDLADGSLQALAPAKLNLFLEILGKQPDGYHALETLMVSLDDWHDTLSFELDPSGRIRLDCTDPSLPTGSDNLVVRAAERLKTKFGTPLGARIRLDKAIPAQAGLAGGSSDAAATLRALDRLWNLDTPGGELQKLAATLGSDVPFFLVAKAAVCRGRGEQVEPIELPMRLHCVVICPPRGLSTAEVYRNVRLPDERHAIEPLLNALTRRDVADLGRCLFNRLQEPAERLLPHLGQIRHALATVDPPLVGHLMSGSGSAVFGLARDLTAANAAAAQLGTLGLGQVRVVTCGP